MLEVYSDPEFTAFSIKANVDFTSVERLEHALTTGGTENSQPLVVDLTDCDYIDSSCLTLFLRQHRLIGARLRIVVPKTARTRKTFEVTGLIDALPIFSSVDGAIVGREDVKGD